MATYRRVGGLARACHPGPTIVVTLIATTLALAVGRGAGAAWVATAVGAGQLSVGWSNDYVDHQRDAAIGRTDKPIVSGDASAFLVGISAVIALVTAVVFSFGSGWRALLIHVVALAAGWAYNLRLKSTVLSPLPYAVAFAALPAFVVVGLPDHPWPPAWMMLAGALLGVGAHFANVLPDLADDTQQEVIGLPHRLGHHKSTVIAAALLFSATTVLVAAPPSAPDALGLAGLIAVAVLAAVLLLPRHTTSRTAFRLAMAIAVVNIVLLVARGQTLP